MNENLLPSRASRAPHPASNHAGRAVLMGALLAVLGASLGCSFLKPKPKKAFGEDCTQDLDCDSMQCSTYGSICSKDCTLDKDCGGDLVCRSKDTGDGNQCSKSVGNAPNAACMSPAECANGHCLKRIGEEDQPGICSKYCASGDDCPAGMKICEKISDSGTLMMCLPGDPAAPATNRPKFGPAPKGPAVKRPTVGVTPPPPVVAPPPVATPAKTPVAPAKPPPRKPH